MKILILGGDGYLGWPTAMAFSARGDDVRLVDNFSKRQWELEEGIETLRAVPTLHKRLACWREITGNEIALKVGDLCNYRFIYKVIEQFLPDVVIHYGEQPSAPYSMASREKAVFTQSNNVIGTLNVLFAMQACCPQAHLIKLGTMGEYGTPNIDIEEGWIDIHHNGRTDTVLYPKSPHSMYHLSKVHDSHNIAFACRVWGLKATDLNQGVVYGVDTEQTVLHDDLRTSFHYDHVFGTVLNRFMVQAIVGEPLSVYGKGGQTRGFLNIKDTLQCVLLAADNPAQNGEFRVFNQFTELFSVLDLAAKVKSSAERLGIEVVINHIENPRIEKESHYYNAKHSKLCDLGLEPHLLSNVLLDEMMQSIRENAANVNSALFKPTIKWLQNARTGV